MFRFTIRDVLWLILVGAVALSWLSSDLKRAAELQSAKAQHAKQADQFYASTVEGAKAYRGAGFDLKDYEYELARRQRHWNANKAP